MVLHLHETNCWIPPASPLRLLFEDLKPNHAWRVVITALLTEDAETAEDHAQKAPYIFDLFERYPDAESVLDAEESSEEMKKMRSILKPLFGKRKDVLQLANFFVEKDWTTPRDWNFGNRFINDCYNVFVCGRWRFTENEFEEIHPLIQQYLKFLEKRGKIESHLCDHISKTNKHVEGVLVEMEKDAKKRKGDMKKDARNGKRIRSESTNRSIKKEKSIEENEQMDIETRNNNGKSTKEKEEKDKKEEERKKEKEMEEEKQREQEQKRKELEAAEKKRKEEEERAKEEQKKKDLEKRKKEEEEAEKKKKLDEAERKKREDEKEAQKQKELKKQEEQKAEEEKRKREENEKLEREAEQRKKALEEADKKRKIEEKGKEEKKKADAKEEKKKKREETKKASERKKEKAEAEKKIEENERKRQEEEEKAKEEEKKKQDLEKKKKEEEDQVERLRKEEEKKKQEEAEKKRISDENLRKKLEDLKNMKKEQRAEERRKQKEGSETKKKTGSSTPVSKTKSVPSTPAPNTKSVPSTPAPTPTPSKTTLNGNVSTPQSSVNDTEVEENDGVAYEVENILGWVVRDGRILLNVSWVGYPGENSEEPLHCFDDEIAYNYLRKENHKLLRKGNDPHIPVLEKEMKILKERLEAKGLSWDSSDEVEDDLQMADSPARLSQKVTVESDEEEESILVPSSQVITKTVQSPPQRVSPRRSARK